MCEIAAMYMCIPRRRCYGFRDPRTIRKLYHGREVLYGTVSVTLWWPQGAIRQLAVITRDFCTSLAQHLLVKLAVVTGDLCTKVLFCASAAGP